MFPSVSHFSDMPLLTKSSWRATFRTISILNEQLQFNGVNSTPFIFNHNLFGFRSSNGSHCHVWLSVEHSPSKRELAEKHEVELSLQRLLLAPLVLWASQWNAWRSEGQKLWVRVPTESLLGIWNFDPNFNWITSLITSYEPPEFSLDYPD